MADELAQNTEEVSAFLARPDAVEKPADPVAAAPTKTPEEALADLLLSIEGDKMTLDAFQFLFELLDDYSQEYHKLTIKKLKNLFGLIFSLLLACDDQVKVVKALVNLVQAQPSVKQFCKETEWLTSLLQFLPNFEDPVVLDELMILVEALAKHHINAKQVKMIFHLLQSEQSTFKAYYWTHIFQLLQRLWHGRAGKPDHYFEFDGNQSGLVLPAMKFPSSGYSLCTWVYIESFQSPYVKDAYMPFLFSFVTDEGLGIESFFVNQQLQFRSTVNTKLSSSKNSTKGGTFAFRPKQWYFVAITHTANFIRSDELVLYIDGNLIQNVSISFPKLDKPAKNCRIGNSVAAQGSPKFALRGQLAGFAFFEDLFSPDDVKYLYSVGPNLFGSLRGVIDFVGGQRAGLFSQKKAKLMFLYSPKAANGAYCSEPLTKQPERRALKLDGVRECITSGIQESLYSLGGIQLLLPLFSNQYRPKLSEPIDVNMKVFSLTAELVKGNAYYQMQLTQTKFFDIMGHLLADPQFTKTNIWSPQAVVCLEELSRAIYSFDTAVAANAPFSEVLFRQFFKTIYLNFKIWNNTDVSVQKILLHSVYSHVKKDPEFFRTQLLTVENVISILAEYFSYSNSKPGAQTTDRDWLKFPRADLLELRWMVLEILRALCARGLTFLEVKCLITYLQEENQKPEDKRLIVDILQVILTFVHENPTNIIPHLQKLGSFKPFLPLLRTENEKFRVWTLKVIGKLYHHAQTGPVGIEDLEVNLVSLKKVMEPYSFTFNIYNALLEILLDQISIGGLDNPITISGVTSPNKRPLVLKNMRIIPIIFDLLGINSDIDLRDRVVKDFIVLLQSQSDSRVKFLELPAWQSFVFHLLVIHEKAEPVAAPASAAAGVASPRPIFRDDPISAIRTPSVSEQRLQSSVTDLVTLLLEHSLFSVQPGSTKVFTNTMTYLANFRGTPNFDCAVVAETITRKILRTLLENQDLMARSSQNPLVWQNAVHFLFFVEEFLFSLPYGVSIGTSTPSLSSSLDAGFLSVSTPPLPSTPASVPNPAVVSTPSTNPFGPAPASQPREIAQPQALSTPSGNPFGVSPPTFSLPPPQSPKVVRTVDAPHTPSLRREGSSLLFTPQRNTTPLAPATPVPQPQPPPQPVPLTQAQIEAHMSNIVQLFGTATPPVPGQTPMPATLLASRLHYDSRGLWRAFSTVQRLLEFLDSFVQIKFSSNPFDEVSLETYNRMEDRIRKFQMRLVIYSIRESAAYKSTQRIKLRKDSFINIKSVVETSFKNITSIQASLSQYLLKKTQQWDLQMSDVETMSQKNLKRIKDICISCKSNQTAFYLLCFTHSVMQLPDIGKDEALDHLVTALFEVMSINIRTRLIDLPDYAPHVKSIPNEGLVPFFVSSLNNVISSPIRDLLVQSTYLSMAEEIAALRSTKEGLRRRQKKITEELLISSADEMEKHKKYQDEFEFISRSFALEAVDARNKFKIRHSQYSSTIASEWKYVLRLLTDSRGPWASRKDLNEKVYWKLDTTETRTRMRLKLKRHYGSVELLEKASKLNDMKKLERQQLLLSGPAVSQVEGPTSPKKQADNLLAALPKGKPGTAMSYEEEADEPTQPEPAAETTTAGPTAQQSADPATNENATPKKKKEEKTIYTTQVEYIRGITVVQGDFEVTNFHIYFRNLDLKSFKTIPIDKIRCLYSRRYMLRTTALEVFTTNRMNYFFNFPKPEDSSIVLKHIVSMRPANLGDNWYSGHPSRLMKKKKQITEAWRKREISNFEYLMELNTIAGRTYNDLGQYPVFPWIISDYTSKKLDLNDAAVYRDLSKPVGALEPTRLNNFLERWENFGDSNTPKFLYGSHYSSMAIVLFYLLRLEPFTSQLITLQGGQFDLGARMFWSLPKIWENCLVNPTDVKELIPEFFCSADFLTCINHVNLGALPNGTDIGDVQLPPWADNAHTFIQINRAALESDYVSAHLHGWIDLIFGFKQQGQAAVDANNVFYYLTYEGAVDIDQITDPLMKDSVLSQIREFGQTPCQLFTTPHPSRLTGPEMGTLKRGLTNMLETVLAPQPEVPTPAFLGKVQIIRTRNSGGDDKAIIRTHVNADQTKIYLVFKDGLTFPISYKPPSKSRKFPLSVSSSPEYDIISSPQRLKEHDLEMLISSVVPSTLLSNCVAFTQDSKNLLHCGNWDNSIVITNATDASQFSTVFEHKDVVTCLAISQDGSTLVTASNDCHCLLWDLDSITRFRRDKSSPNPKPRRILAGHDEAITCISVNSDLDIVVTASLDKTCIISSLTKGRYFRTVQHAAPVTLVVVSPYGDLISYCPQGGILYLHSLNGKLLKVLYNVGQLSVLRLSQDGKLLITAGNTGGITVRTLHLYSLRKIWRWQCLVPVTSLELTPKDEYLLVGLQDGSLLAMVFDMNNLLTDMCFSVK